MSNPNGPSTGDAAQWNRPAGASEPATESMAAAAAEPATTRFAADPATARLGAAETTGATPAPGGHPTAPPGAPAPAPAAAPAPAGRRGLIGLLSNPLSVALVLVTVLALALAGLIGAEFIARRIGDGKVEKATECVVQDKATASFGVTPPFLWQHITGEYTNISIHTAGNQVKEAKKMKADLNIADVRLTGDADSRGTIGKLDVALTWPADGIAETVRAMIPMFGSFVSDVSTDPANGTVELNAALASVTVKPEVVDGGLSLKMQKLTGLGAFALPRELIQPALDTFANELTKRYPLGLRADSVEVTSTGVLARFSARNARIPRTDNPCFANL